MQVNYFQKTFRERLLKHEKIASVINGCNLFCQIGAKIIVQKSKIAAKLSLVMTVLSSSVRAPRAWKIGGNLEKLKRGIVLRNYLKKAKSSDRQEAAYICFAANVAM